MSHPPHPLPSHMPQPSQLAGDQLDIAEMSRECSFEDDRSDPARELLVMTVDLGKGKKDRLVVRDCDNPRKLAKSFCAKHGLSDKLAEALTTNIEANLEQVGDGEADSLMDPSGLATEEQVEAGAFTFQPPKPFVHIHYHSNPRNIGDRLYSQAISSKGSRALQCLKSRQESQQEINRELTFAPQIRQSIPIRSEESTWQQQLAIKREVEVKRREIMKEETDQCTFSPVLCQRFEVLYQQANVRRAKAERISEDHFASICPFRPSIPSSPSSESITARIEKLYTSRRRTNAELDIERIRQHRQMQDFHPKVGRPPTAVVPLTQRDSKVPIGDYLHMRVPIRCEAAQSSTSVGNYLVSKFESDRLYDKMKSQCFREIFDALKPCSESSLTAESCSLDRLRPELAAILSPLIDELKQLGENLDFEEFCASMENLLRELTPTERALVIRRNPKPISSHSSIGYSKARREHSPNLLDDLPFYERAMLYKKVRLRQLQEDRLIEEKAATENLIAEQCTFRPSVGLISQNQSGVEWGRNSGERGRHGRGNSLR